MRRRLCDGKGSKSKRSCEKLAFCDTRITRALRRGPHDVILLLPASAQTGYFISAFVPSIPSVGGVLLAFPL